MGWTKHHDSVQHIKSQRSKALVDVNRLYKKLHKPLKADEDWLTLIRAFHSELNTLCKLHNNLGNDRISAGRPISGSFLDMAPFFDVLLKMSSNWEFQMERRNGRNLERDPTTAVCGDG